MLAIMVFIASGQRLTELYDVDQLNCLKLCFQAQWMISWIVMVSGAKVIERRRTDRFLCRIRNQKPTWISEKRQSRESVCVYDIVPDSKSRRPTASKDRRRRVVCREVFVHRRRVLGVDKTRSLAVHLHRTLSNTAQTHELQPRTDLHTFVSQQRAQYSTNMSMIIGTMAPWWLGTAMRGMHE